MPEPTAQTVLGFDFGLKRIGVAVGQTLTRTATPLKILTTINNKPDWASIEALIKEWQPDRLIVGIPLNMDGTEQAMTAAAGRFSRQLEGRFGLPIEGIDERLSTVEAENTLRDRGVHADNTAQTRDAVAAEIILMTWFEMTCPQAST